MTDKQAPQAQPKDNVKPSEKQADKSSVHPLSSDELKDVSGGMVNAQTKEEMKK